MAVLLERETEFVVTPGGLRLTGSCGPNALGGVLRRAAQSNKFTTLATYSLMLNRGWCSRSGVANGGKLALAARAFGFTADYSGYTSDDWGGWRAWLDARLLKLGWPTVLELSHGQALVDAISGKGENARGLRYHFISALAFHPGGPSARAAALTGGRVKTLPAGYWCADGDNFAAGNVLQFYPLPVLSAAMPCAGVAVKPTVALPGIDALPAASTSASSGSSSSSAAGAKGAGGSILYLPTALYGLLRAPDGSYHCAATGRSIRGGFQEYYDALAKAGATVNAEIHPERILGLPLTEEYAWRNPRTGETHTRQDYERGSILSGPTKEDPWGIAHVKVSDLVADAVSRAGVPGGDVAALAARAATLARDLAAAQAAQARASLALANISAEAHAAVTAA